MLSRLSVLAAAACLLAPPLAAQASSTRIIPCGTDSRQRVQCDAGGQVTKVKLVRDLSNRCGPAGSWGWTERTVWADNGCRGEFEVDHRTQPTRRITCGTLTTSQARCSTEGPATSVRMIRRTLFARCTEGSNWGYSDTLIWAGKGCRAEFEVTYRDSSTVVPTPVPATKIITCGSASGRLDTCKTGGSPASVRLVRDLSDNRCRKGANWDYNATLVWARDGCRGEFEVTYTDASTPSVRRITCGATSGTQVTCKTDGYATAVRLVRDLSGGECRKGSTWGNTDSFIWANKGCRAEFEVSYRRGASPQPAPAPDIRVITCGNASGSAMSCNAFGTVATVSLKRDRSAGRCSQSSSWGLDQESIWVARGCHGDFELTYGAGMKRF